MFHPALSPLLGPSGCLQTGNMTCGEAFSALDLICFPVPSRTQPDHDDESWLFALAVPNTTCRGNAGYVRLDRQRDDSVRRSQGIVGGLSTPVRHLHCPSDVYINATTHYCIHRQWEEEEESCWPDRARGPFFIFTDASRLPGILPGLGCTQVLAKCSHPELSPKRTSALCKARSSAGVWQRLTRLSESHSVLPRG